MHLANKKGKPFFNDQMKNAFYGTQQAALIFCKLLSDTIIDWGFTINPYDQCVANKIINR